MMLQIQQQSCGVLNLVADGAKEGDSLTAHTMTEIQTTGEWYTQRAHAPSINQPVVVRQSEVHHWSDFHLSIHSHRPGLRRVHAQDRRLGRVDDWSAQHGPKHTAVGNGERAARHVLNRNLIVASLRGG